MNFGLYVKTARFFLSSQKRRPTSLPHMLTLTMLFCMSYPFSFSFHDQFQFVWRNRNLRQDIIKALSPTYRLQQFDEGSKSDIESFAILELSYSHYTYTRFLRNFFLREITAYPVVFIPAPK